MRDRDPENARSRMPGSRSNSLTRQQAILPSISPPVVVTPTSPLNNHHNNTTPPSANNLALPNHAAALGAATRRSNHPFFKSNSIECGMLSSMLMKNTDKFSDRIIINVSGRVFEALIKDLEKFPNTLLGNSELRKQHYDAFRGEYYFNRNQVAFDSILYYYQSGGDIYQPDGLPDTVFERELEFFQLVDDTVEIQSVDAEPELTHSDLVGTHRGLKRWKSALWGFVEYPKSSLPARIWATSNILIIVISVINLIWESIPKYRENTTIRTFFIVDTVCVSYFTLDLVLRLGSTPTLVGFIRNVLNWFDFLAIIPFYVELVVGGNSAGLAAFRILRLFRITRLFKLIRHSSRMMLMMEVVSNCLSELIMLFLTWVMGTLIFGTIMFYVEEGSTSKFKSILHACWWAAVTMTTVGYGDIYPETPLGQTIGSVILFLSMIYIALPMTLIVSKFSSTLSAHHEAHQERRRKWKKMPKHKEDRHGLF